MWLHRLMLGLVLTLGGVFVQAAEKPALLLGQWQCQNDEGQVLLEFQSANRLIFDGEPSRYSLQPGIIVVEEEFGPVPYPYTVQGNKLTVQFPDGDVLRCSRAAPAGKAAPPAAGGGNNAQLKGRMCNWGGSSSSYSRSGYSRITTMVFDGAGGVVYSNEATFSGDAGGYYGKSGGVPGRYQVSGDSVQIQLENGSKMSGRVNMRHSGRITELMINGQLWAGALCE